MSLANYEGEDKVVKLETARASDEGAEEDEC